LKITGYVGKKSKCISFAAKSLNVKLFYEKKI